MGRRFVNKSAWWPNVRPHILPRWKAQLAKKYYFPVVYKPESMSLDNRISIDTFCRYRWTCIEMCLGHEFFTMGGNVLQCSTAPWAAQICSTSGECKSNSIFVNIFWFVYNGFRYFSEYFRSQLSGIEGMESDFVFRASRRSNTPWATYLIRRSIWRVAPNLCRWSG